MNETNLADDRSIRGEIQYSELRSDLLAFSFDAGRINGRVWPEPDTSNVYALGA